MPLGMRAWRLRSTPCSDDCAGSQCHFSSTTTGDLGAGEEAGLGRRRGKKQRSVRTSTKSRRMSETPLPAWARTSSVLRLPGVASLDGLTPEWAWGDATGEGIRIAVIDSGVEAEHPALEGCV